MANHRNRQPGPQRHAEARPDDTEKKSDKTEAIREVEHRHVDENVIAHARIPRESDGR